ncbi:ABC transporter permease subunit [Clostridium ljungdahlii]|uniref:ABC-2 family transporter protein n=1 Tax=Clostridium ljungdahlii TaxID=1538 RepID=A0A162NC28_9CLOT|nr:ABC transporter permease [Clostridium ljungdahlii]OAA91639.1 ABC-2 family transporter protein [Clostridium ljungdahlii]
MNKYIWQELKRVMIKKKIALIVILIITIVFGLMVISKIDTLEVQIQKDKVLLNTLKMDKTKADTEFKKADISRDILETQKEINDKEEMLNQINNYDKSKLDKQIEKLEKENNPKNEYKILQLKYEKEHNIEKSELTPKGMYAAIDILQYFVLLFLIIPIVLSSDIVSGEYSPNTIKALITKPISRKKIIASKFIVSVILSAGTIIISTIIFIVEAGIHLGFSDYRLPFDVGAKYVLDKSLPLSPVTSQMKYVSGSRSIIPLWSVILQLILILIVISVAIISIIMFISTICRNSLISSLASFILIAGTQFWYLFCFSSKYLVAAKYGAFVKFLPTPYMVDSLGTLSGDISLKLASSINVFFVLIVCLLWTLVMMFLSIYVFGKRDLD